MYGLPSNQPQYQPQGPYPETGYITGSAPQPGYGVSPASQPAAPIGPVPAGMQPPSQQPLGAQPVQNAAAAEPFAAPQYPAPAVGNVFAAPGVPGQIQQVQSPLPQAQQPLPNGMQPQQPTQFVQQQAAQPAFESNQPPFNGQGIPGRPVNPMYNPTAPYGAAAPIKRGLSCKLILPIAALATLLISAGGGIAYMQLKGKSIAYSTADLTNYSTQTYQMSVPKQWSEQSNNTEFTNKIMGGDSMGDIKDLKTYTHNFDAKQQDAETILMTGYIETGTGDDELRQTLTSQANRDDFAAAMSKAVDNLGTGSDSCQNVTNRQTKTDFNSDVFILRFEMSADCDITVSNQAGVKGGSAHLQMQMGAKNSKFYVSMLVTLMDDWQRNQAFYKDHVLYSLNPKQ